jgi:hypothetical protein
MDLFNTWWAIIRDGLHHIAPIQGLIIGLIFGWMASSIGSVIFGALGASVVYVAVDTLWPVVFQHKTFALPVFDTPFWHFFLALYFAFLVIVALIYIVKQVVGSFRG